MKTELEARKEATILIGKMKTKGWKARVWENLGWHYEIRKGCISIYPSGIGDKLEYFALMGDGWGVGEIFWSEQGTFCDPNIAYERQIELARAHVSKCIRMIRQSGGLLNNHSIIDKIKELAEELREAEYYAK